MRSVTPDGEPDANSHHGGSPVISGVKWSATKWIRSHTFREQLAGDVGWGTRRDGTSMKPEKDAIRRHVAGQRK